MKVKIFAVKKEIYMRKILGKPMFQYVVEAVTHAGLTDISVVIIDNNKSIEAEIKNIFKNINISTHDSEQEEKNKLLTLGANMPLITSDEIKELIKQEEKRIYEAPASTHVNTEKEIAEAIAVLQTRINEKHMSSGVRFIDPKSVFIDSTVEIEAGATIYPNVIIEGDSTIMANAIIGANSQIKDSFIGAFAHVKYSVLDGARVGAKTDVGPFAYLRPEAVIGKSCRIGNFVEVKKANIGDNTKMAHLAYVGDADVGNDVNIGCGVITVNYDGAKKHRTTIGDKAFIGSNSNLVAPVEIGTGAFVAAGSTVTENIPEDALGIARAYQVIKLNWRKK